MPRAAPNIDLHGHAYPRAHAKPPFMSKLLVLLGTISLLTPFTLDIYLPALPAIAADLRASARGPRLWLRLLCDKRYMRYALPATLMQSSVFAYIAGAPFVYIDHFRLSPQQFAWMFGCNAIGLMIAGHINAHIVSALGPELIFRRAMLGTAALGIVLFGMARSCRSQLLFLIIYGPGKLSLDYLLNRSRF
jgi:hypothetical protein